MLQLTPSGHVLYCVVRAAQMLQQPHPDLPRIQFVLSSARRARSDEAMYFLIMLKVLASEGFDRDRVLCLFHDLFTRQRLAHCRSVISADDLLFDWGQLKLRFMPPGLEYKFTCLSNGTCAISNRILNSHLPSAFRALSTSSLVGLWGISAFLTLISCCKGPKGPFL